MEVLNSHHSGAAISKVFVSPLTRLREATAPLHRQLDQDSCMAQLMDAQLTLVQYGQILQALHQIYAPLEKAFAAQQKPSDQLPPWVAKTRLLQWDLALLGCTPIAPLGNLALPDLALASQRAGVQYVLEGACLGGLVIRKKLLNQWGDQADGFTRFFAGQGAETARHWAAICLKLNAMFPASEGTAPLLQACQSARQTFELFIAGMNSVCLNRDQPEPV